MPGDPLEIKLNGGDSLKFSGKLRDSIFSKKLLPFEFPPEWDLSVEDPINTNSDSYNSYRLNNYGYRGPDFGPDIDVLAAGCSMTFGVGVPDNGTWPSLFSEKSGLSVANLSAPAASIEWIVNSIFSYIETFGKPRKGIIVHFPDLLRGEIVVDEEVVTASEWGPKDFHQVSLDDNLTKKIVTHGSLTLVSEDYPAPKILKKPYPIEYTKTREEAVRQSFSSIKNLEIFCKAADIPLVWSSWSFDLHESMKNISKKYKFSNFSEMSGMGHWKSHRLPLNKTENDPEGIFDYKINHQESTLELYGCSDEMEGRGECICFSTCHFDLADKYGSSFHMATDRYDKFKGIGQAHFGVHKYIHMADAFIDMFNNIKKRKVETDLREKMEEASELDKELIIEFESEAQEIIVNAVLRDGQLRLKEDLIETISSEVEKVKKEHPEIDEGGQDWLDGVGWVLHLIREHKLTV